MKIKTTTPLDKRTDSKPGTLTVFRSAFIGRAASIRIDGDFACSHLTRAQARRIGLRLLKLSEKKP